MSSGYGDNSEANATSDDYRDGWERIYGNKEPMASSTSEPMPQTVEAYKALAQRDHDLIVEMKLDHLTEVSKLKARVNKLEQSIMQCGAKAIKDAHKYAIEQGSEHCPELWLEYASNLTNTEDYKQ
jgi:hypothetical protein